MVTLAWGMFTLELAVSGVVGSYWSCAVLVAVLVTVVPAALAVGVTNRFNVALLLFKMVPMFHIPVTELYVPWLAV